MTEADVRWLQRAVATARERPLSELEEQGLIQAFAFTHELSWLLREHIQRAGQVVWDRTPLPSQR